MDKQQIRFIKSIRIFARL